MESQSCLKIGSLVVHVSRPELGVGKVLDHGLTGRLSRVAWPHAEDGAYALMVRDEDVRDATAADMQRRPVKVN